MIYLEKKQKESCIEEKEWTSKKQIQKERLLKEELL